MSHHIYTTPGFVIGSRPHGEGGKILFIFSAELGHVSAIAQGIRLSKSKLRYHAQDYALANFSLVRGKDFWRIVGAEAAGALEISTGMPAAYALRVRIFSVLSRLLQGEEKNAPLFDTVTAAYHFLSLPEAQDFIAPAEPIIMLRILNHLGYVRNVPELAPFLADNALNSELFTAFSAPGVRAQAIKEINTALKESHL